MPETTDLVLTGPQAQEILGIGKASDVFEGAIPEGQAAMVEAAGELVFQAEQAEKMGVRSDAVKDILRVARDSSWTEPGKHGNASLTEIRAQRQARDGVEASSKAIDVAPEEEEEPAGPPQVEQIPGLDDGVDEEQVVFLMQALRQGWSVADVPQEVYNEAVKRINVERAEAEELARAQAAGYPGSEQEPVDYPGVEEATVEESAAAVSPDPAAADADGGPDGSPSEEEVGEDEPPDEEAGLLAKADFRAMLRERRERALARINRERLPIPPDVAGEPPVLPRDISQLSDGDLRSLHGEFHACLARTRWLEAVEESDYESATAIADERVNTRLRDLEGRYADTRTVTSLKAEAQDEDKVRELRHLAGEHQRVLKRLRALREIYDSTCARISREMTFRSEEKESAARPRIGGRA